MSETTDDLDRPRFVGCPVCYGAGWVAYGVRRLRRRAGDAAQADLRT